MRYIYLAEARDGSYEEDVIALHKRIEREMKSEIGQNITVINYADNVWGMGCPSYQWVSGKLCDFKRTNDIWEDTSVGYTFYYEEGTARKNSSIWNGTGYAKASHEEVDEVLIPHGYMRTSTNEAGVIITPRLQLIFGVYDGEDHMEILEATGILVGGPEGIYQIEKHATPEKLSELLNTQEVMKCEKTLETLLGIWERKTAA